MRVSKGEIHTFFKLVEQIANNLEQEGWKHFDFNNKIKKANLIREALNRVRSEFNNKQDPSRQETLHYHSISQLMDYKQDNQLSLFEAIDFKRYLFEQTPTSTLSELEENLRRVGDNVGYRQLIELMRKKVALEYHGDIDNITVKKQAEGAKLILPDQGVSSHGAQPTGSMNAQVVAILTNAKLPTLVAKHRNPKSFLSSASVAISFQEDCYEKIIAGLEALPDHQQVTGRYYNK